MPSEVVMASPWGGEHPSRAKGRSVRRGRPRGHPVWTQSQAHGGNLTGRRAKGITTPSRGVYERAFEPRAVWEGPLGTSDGCPPDAGNPTARDERGACGNVNHGGMRNPLHNRKGAGRKLSTYRGARRISTRLTSMVHSGV
jgi:hypothetical protein